ncbi:uncharacterized protein LOC116349303 isoform X6 [Contarinia nasturtii]|uniref:uncharacterized protein LOC116349303 isoform X6 n=1 Tax=Contarinia nasturtii TaxID=265458 RepID=UPI0012D3FA46|nr:uncharacterized protein LOC116349303 isoform X6 [Contarinia nasturtii]
MPWNCLCSSKSKNRRPQISAPILCTEDIQKLQLIPLQKPLITSKHLHEKLVQPENDAVGVSQPLHNNVDIEQHVSTATDVEKPLQSSQSAIDLARAQLGSVGDNEPLVQDETTATAMTTTTTTATASSTAAKSQKSIKKDIKRTKRLEKKRLKQQQKQLKKLNKKAKKEKNNNNKNNRKPNDETNNDSSSSNSKKTNEALQSNLKNRSHTLREPIVPRAKSKSPVNVTFAFDTIEHSSDANNHDQIVVLHHLAHKDIVHSANHIGNGDDVVVGGNATDGKSNGEYDSLPLIKVEKSADIDMDSDFAEKIDGNGNVVIANVILPISCSSSDSIPFIDDSPNPRRAGCSIPIEPHKNLYDSRFITLQPRNIGAQSMIYARKLEKPLPIAFKIPTKRDQFDKSAQILYQSLKESIDHHFDRVAHLHNKLCQVCHEFLLVPDAVKCLTCGIVCHHSCTMPQKNYDAKSQISKSQTFPLKLSQYQDKTAADHLGLNYVTERILASVLPNRAQTQQPKRDNESTEIGDTPTHDESPQDIYEQELISMLEQKHGKNYKLFDLESCISTITLEKLCELCKHMDSWLGSGREKVVILQDRGDRQRLGSAIAAYLEYLNICASTYAHRNGLSNEDARAQSAIARNWLDLDIFSMKKFLEDVIGPLRVPSHRRYLKYFSGLLSGKIKINSLPLYLRFITIESPPSWLQHEPIALQQAEWRSFIKIYEGLNCVFTSDIHVIPITTRQFIYEIGQLRLRGDVIIRCYQITTTTNERTLNLHSAKTINRELIFSTQFHTCAITERDITFYRNELDYACDDPRIPVDHKVTLHFGDNNQLNENRGLHFQSPLVKLEPLNAVAKYNSLERFDDDSLHTQGPLDGSLYATILKSPKSPLKSPTFPPAFISNIVNNNHQRSSTNLSVISSTPKTSSTQNLISPPPEFSNKKIVEIKECYTTLSPIGASPKIDSNLSAQNKSLSRSYTSTPSYEEIQVPSRSSSREATLRYQTAPRSSSSLSTVYQQQPDLPQRSSSASRAGNYTSNQSNQYIRTTVVDNYNYVNAVQNGNRNQSYQDGRESVKSPLTLSMDSGISSSGIANRRIQGSSVSPSSYPSQSPQDRHQELDDILSDMLLTVQGIPDIGKTQQNREVIRKTTTTTQNSTVQNQQRPQLHLQIPKQQQPPLPLSQQQQQHLHLQPLYGSTNTVKRSQSYTSQDESNCSTISRSTVHTTGHIRDRVCGDFYDTASTTTTITPTPSESGRITPFQQQHQYTRNDNKLTQQAIEQRERELIMDLQNQSFDYSHPLRTGSSAATVNDFKSIKVNNSGVTSEDDESIPYHAREDSRPFTYGDATGVQLSPTSIRKATGTATGTGMIKLQSGLSSPSLVRKHLGSNATNPPTTARKSPNNGRNDFEEMLLQRREKILNDKYSIGDKTPNGNSVSETNNLNASATNKWNTSSNTLNGYQYHEPLKRSNTMDGGFGRGNTSGYVSDGSSGQTWLQLQQQKLRAKKELQHKGDNEYCERNVHIDNRNRPLRSRSSQSSHRYDGYSSDTGAFDSRAFIDEVDYRQPLHVQTPNRPNERYHTITKTTTATNERPFVSVKRAHEQSKANNNIIGVREESFSSYRSETEPETSLAGSPRPETPAFPLTPRTPYGLNGNISPALPPKSPTSIRRLNMIHNNGSTWSLRSGRSTATYDWSKEIYSGGQTHHINQNDVSCYTSRRNSTTSTANSEPQEIAPHLVKFVRDSSKFWYKPTISREEAIALLRNAHPGSFLVRDSTTFAKAFGLVLKVSHPPPGVQSKGTGDELVRHFLVEPTTRGVRLKGCSNEPVFTSLSALVYQHSITPLALPCKLIIPDRDLQNVEYHSPAQQQLMTQGAACNVLFLFTYDTESLTGPEAIRKAVSLLYSRKPLPKPTEVHFKVTQQGITLTDNTRQLFFRKHYPANNISFCGLDPDDRRWSIRVTGEVPVSNKTIFAFVARRSTSSNDNQCHVFCELEPNQPAAAITAFANKVIPSYGAQPYLQNI